MSNQLSLKDAIGTDFNEAIKLTNDAMSASILVLAYQLAKLDSMREEQVARVTQAMKGFQDSQ